MVAESTEILAPMSQVGWATASSGVAAAIAARLRARNGPPEAVSTIFSTRSGRSKSKTWKMALCSESTGRSVAPPRAAAAIIASPAHTRHSLLASATTAPRRRAAMVGARPAAPTMAAITHSAGRAAASTSASGPAATRTGAPSSSALRAE